MCTRLTFDSEFEQNGRVALPEITPVPINSEILCVEQGLFNEALCYDTRIPWPNTTVKSGDWILLNNSSIFWPTWTNYLYGPTTGPLAAGVTCIAQNLEWSARSRALLSIWPTRTGPEVTSTSTITQNTCGPYVYTPKCNFPMHGLTTTICGVTRVLPSTQPWPPPAQPQNSACPPFTQTWTTSTSTVYVDKLPPKTCTTNVDLCYTAFSSYSARSSAAMSASNVNNISYPHPRPDNICRDCYKDHCERPCDECYLHVSGTVRLYYWPVTATGEVCGNRTTVTPTLTAPPHPNTAVVSGMTFTSPSVYMLLPEISAGYDIYRVAYTEMCGARYTNRVVSLHPSNVSSIRGPGNVMALAPKSIHPFNFADFNRYAVGNVTMSLVPEDAYKGAMDTWCDGWICFLLAGYKCTRVIDDYQPKLSFPNELVQSMDPNWKGKCSLSDGERLRLKVDYVSITSTPESSPITISMRSRVIPPTPTPTSGGQ